MIISSFLLALTVGGSALAVPPVSMAAAILTAPALLTAPAPVGPPVASPAPRPPTSWASTPDTLRAPTLDRIVSLPNLAGTAPSAPIWSPDGTRVAFLWNDHGMPFRDVWVVEALTGALARITWLAPDPADVLGPGDDSSTEALMARAAAREDRGISQVLWGPEGAGLLYVRGGRVHHAAATTTNAPTTPHPVILEGAGGLQLAPDGSLLAFLRSGDLWVVALAQDGGDAASGLRGGEPRRLTHLGEPSIATVSWGAYLQPDVYVASYAWSPDAGAIAFQHVDQRAVRRVPFPSYLPTPENPEPFLHEVRRPYPGDTVLVRRIGIVELGTAASAAPGTAPGTAPSTAPGTAPSTAAGTAPGTGAGERGTARSDPPEPLFLPLPAPHRRVIHDMAWSPDGAQILVLQGADVAEERWIYRASRDGTQLDELLHDHRPRRIYAPFRAVWSGSGNEVIYLGDQEGWYRLYAMSAGAVLPASDARAAAVRPRDARPATSPDPSHRPLTGAFDVSSTRGAPWLAVRGDVVFFQGAADSPYERHVYRVHLGAGDAGGAGGAGDANSDGAGTPQPAPRLPAMERLTHIPGIHEPVLSPDGRWLAVVTSSDTMPSELFLLPVTDDGSARERRITHSPLPEFDRYAWLTPRYVSFPSRIDDFTLHARIIEPPDMEPGRTYPVILGSVYSNTVLRWWNPDRPTSILQQQMAMAGDYITVLVDVRGSIGYGVDFREAFQGDWGGDDLEDLHSALDYLTSLPHVDATRIGMWGNSYGGLLVLAALFRKPGLFAAGVAGAPAVDVHHFTGGDQHLTRYPSTHPEIFERTLLRWGQELRDPLLMIHGVHDDIVPLKTTLMLAERLTLLQRPFELELVHNSAHWWAATENYALHTFRRKDAFLRTHVPPGPR